MDGLTRAGYLAHAAGAAFERRIAVSRGVIAAHSDHAISVSWGKDSVVMLALAVETLGSVTAIHGRYRVPCENAGDIDTVRDAVLARPEMRGVRYVEIEIPGEWDLFERAGGPFVEARSQTQREALAWRKATSRGRLRAACEAAGCAGYMIGMRAAESRARMLNIATRGLSYEKRNGLSVALPIGRWQAFDVWAYLVDRDLPWLRIYDVAPDRHRARSMLCIGLGDGSPHLRHGEYQIWRAAYPGEIAVWEQRWPDLRHLDDGNVGAIECQRRT